MAQLAGTTDTYDIRNTEEAETVENIIYRLDPQDTWAMSSAPRKKVSGIKHEWLFESLADATVAAVVEGDDATFAVMGVATRVSNETTILRKTVIVSDTSESVNKYGSKSLAARDMLRKGLELKRDCEKLFWGKQAHTVGTSSSARVSAGMASMIYSNVVKCGGATGSVPGFSAGTWTVPIDGTADGSLDEADLQSALGLAWTAGGNPELLVSGTAIKRRMAAFGGAAAYQGFQTSQGKVQGAVISAIDAYISDYGSHKLILSRYVPTDVLFCVDPEYVSLGFLRPMKKVPLAKTGDATKEMLVVELVPICDNPLAHAQLIDISA
jgi:hypothetical protein